ncbi:MAG: YlbF family regulator [Alicyclobacillus sp.]|nr:YlbF family regulator [Alicyclobacillus sp.]
MPVNPYDKAYELAKSLRESEAYRQLQSARERVQADASTLNMLQDFRSRQLALQAKQLSGQTVTDEERSTLERLAEVVGMNQDVRAYLEAERYFTRVWMDIEKIVAEVADEVLLPPPAADRGEQAGS